MTFNSTELPISSFPSQKKSDYEKSKNDYKWFKDCHNYAKSIILQNNDDSPIRKNYKSKKINYDLESDIIHPLDYDNTLNPLGLEGTANNSIQNYPIINPKIQLLLGEELNRRFDWKVVAINEDVVSQKEDRMMDLLTQLAIEAIKNQEEDPSKTADKLKSLEKYLTYDYQDIKELTSTRILQYHWRKDNIKSIFNKGFKDVLIVGEELYRIDIVSGEPKLTKCDPLKLFTLRNGDSSFLEDADIIAEIDYVPVGAVIDEFYEELKPSDVSKLERYDNYASGKGGAANKNVDYSANTNHILSMDMFSESGFSTDELPGLYTQVYGGGFDAEGNIRVIRTSWRSRRKLYERTFPDENGQLQTDFKSANYKADKSKGETVREIWINEWCECVELGDGIFPRTRPKEVQVRNMTNISKCYSGYVGTYYNTNSSSVVSFMDRAKPLQYMYNVVMSRLLSALSNYAGPILQIDTSYMPDKWTPDKWMYYMKEYNIQIVDSSNEAVREGKLAMTNTTNRYIDTSSMGNYIQQHIMLLDYIETQMATITGITKQREGSIHSSETVGGVERSVNQSSQMTEPYYFMHDDTKKRTLTMFLETCKHVYSDVDNKIIPYITDAMGIAYLRLDKGVLDADTGVFISDSKRDNELFESMKQLAHAGIQNDKIGFKDLISIMSSESMSEIRRTIEQAETDKEARIQKSQEDQMKSQEMMKQAEIQDKNADRASKEKIEAAKIEKDILLKEMELNETDTSLEEFKVKLDEMKVKEQNRLDKLKLEETIRSNKAKEAIAKSNKSS